MNDNEKAILKAVYAAGQRHASNQPGGHPKAQDVFAAVEGGTGLRLDEVAITLLQMRDQGLVETDDPTFGDPADGKFTVHFTPEGMQEVQML